MKDGGSMFKVNNSSQVTMFDDTLYMSDYHKRLLDESWSGYFRTNIFPKIREENFKVLYSDNASRPNTPVNIMIGLLILKELNCETDEELMKSLIFDKQYQYALCTTSFEKQPISRNALTNFRNNLIEYEIETGKDLYKEEIIYLSNEINKCSETETKFKRMDSMMIESRCKHLSRIDLVYKVNINLISKISEVNKTLLGDREKEYLKEGFKKENVYEATKENKDEKLEVLLKDSTMLYEKYKLSSEINQLKEFELLKRLIRDQIDDGTKKPKDSKNIKPDSLQNPSDPDATYRFKYGNNVGYTANVVEDIHENGEIYITDYDYKQNTYSDKEFMEDYIEKKGYDTKETTLVDAAYYSDEINEKAKEKNIELIPTQTMGKTEAKKDIVEFKIDEDNHEILVCPNNEKPLKTSYNEDTHKYHAKFDKQKCENCPFRVMCKKNGYVKKTITSTTFTQESYHKAVLENKMNTDEYKKVSNKRAGIEGTMSVLRRRYKVDENPSTGLLHSKLGFGGKILSINIKKAVRYKKNTQNYYRQTLIFEKLLNFTKIFTFKWLVA